MHDVVKGIPGDVAAAGAVTGGALVTMGNVTDPPPGVDPLVWWILLAVLNLSLRAALHWLSKRGKGRKE